MPKKNINISGYGIETESPEPPFHVPSSYVVVDVETTGLVPGNNKIVQVTAVLFSNHKAESIFSTYINPSCPIPPNSTSIHGITDEMVKDAPLFHQIVNSLDTFVGKHDLVGHNILFDIKFLRKFGFDNEKYFRHYYDTLEFSRYFDTTSYSHTLSSASCYHNIFTVGSHNSSVDALNTALLFQRYIQLYSHTSVETLEKYQSLQKALDDYRNKKG